MVEMLSPRFLSDLVADVGFFSDHQFNPLDSTFDDFDFHSFSSDSNSSSYSPFSLEKDPIISTQAAQEIQSFPRPTKQPKIESTGDPDTNPSLQYPSSNPKIISFGKIDSFGSYDCELKPKMGELCEGDRRSSSIYPQSKKRTFGGMPRSALHPQDHVLAERKRREKLSQRFIALSAIIPGLKKLDKASILEDAIKYMKELQERVTTLEEELETKTTDSVVFVTRSRVGGDDNDDLNHAEPPFERQFPEIDVRVSDKHVLLRIHCKKHQCQILSILNEIEKLNGLSVLSHSVLPFGNSIVDVTVVAKMDVDFNLTIKDLVRNLRQALISSP